MSNDKIPTFQGIDLTGIDPFLAIQASTLLDTCSLEIFRLIALLHRCKQENPATEKLADDLTDALKAILDAHERDVVVRNNNETAQIFRERALLAEEKFRKLNDTVSELKGQIELEAAMYKQSEYIKSQMMSPIVDRELLNSSLSDLVMYNNKMTAFNRVSAESIMNANRNMRMNL